MNQNDNKNNLKLFFYKLAGITLAIIIIINVTYNLIFADKMESINKLLSLNEKENIEKVKDKIRQEIRNGLTKDKIFNEEDKILLYQLYLKVSDEFKSIN